MITYADSSVMVAWFHPGDEFAAPVTHWVTDNVVDFLWNPVLRLEVRHNLRRLRSAYMGVAWNALRAAERSRLRFGRERLQDLIEEADEMSGKFSAEIAAGTWDFFHVATAARLRAQAFATCDQLQAKLAKAMNLPNVKLFTL